MTQQVNLYQPIFRKQEKKFSAAAMLQAVGLVVIGVMVMYAYTWWHLAALRGELKHEEQNQAAAARRLTDATQQFGARTVAGKTLDDEIARLENELASRRRIQEILQRGVFSNTRGFSDYFASFARQHISGVWLTGFDITGAGEQMMLAGRSTNPELVPRYMQRLSTEKTFSGVEFRVFQMDRPAADAKGAPVSYVEFQAKTSGNPG